MNKKIVIFDLDGTLIASLEGIMYSMNSILTKHDYPTHELDEYRLFVGNGLKNLAIKALPQTLDNETVDVYYKELLEFYSDHFDHEMRLYDGIEETLNVLVKRGFTLAINTNKNQKISEKIIHAFLSQWDFAHVVGSNSSHPKKPDPAGVFKILEKTGFDKSEAVYVGDTGVDLQTAKNSGIDCITVTWGFRKKEELAPFEPTHFIDNPQDILALLD
ncbi:HAD family hydrolase [Alkalibacter mobilis]|uniref:HAD family hydrolase n=1 Tax=Alkalibacter mobilis TaxID=2787712 RepID=UPI00189F81F6|nr:HAD family hydrolase [Alkalibacter mobilis]MBF7097069.1 HAD family hydrolase [Alkalibacter mobilis]